MCEPHGRSSRGIATRIIASPAHYSSFDLFVRGLVRLLSRVSDPKCRADNLSNGTVHRSTCYPHTGPARLGRPDTAEAPLLICRQLGVR